ncbi:MAG TPA: hypothetical protein VGB83_10095 [Actinomycetota bacterium]
MIAETEAVRAGLEDKLSELGRRIGPAKRRGMRIASGLAGGLTLLAAGMVRARLRSKRAKPAKKTTAAASGAPPIVVRGGISTPAALGVAAIWAAVRIVEWRTRSAPGAQVRALDGKRPA